MKKQLLFVTLMIILAGNIYSQSTLTIGNDTTFCTSGSISLLNIYLGSKVSIKPISQGFTYSWSAKKKSTSISINLTTLLSDVNTENPKFLDPIPNGEWYQFKLKATKGIEILYDSIDVRFSYFTGSLVLGYHSFNVIYKDSMIFDQYYFSGGIQPVSFVTWKPTLGFKNPTQIPTYFVQPETLYYPAKQYYAVLRDSVGCLFESLAYHIVSLPTGIEKEKFLFEAYFYDKVLYVDNKNQDMINIKVFDLKGTLVYEQSSSNKYFDLTFLKKEQQYIVYIVNIKTNFSKILKIIS